jgi:hypothetical protein
MTEPRELQLEHPAAQRLADLAGVLGDLQLVIRACDRFLSIPKVGSETAILDSRSLATFAIVTYCRTMTTGVRSGISQSNLSLLPERLQASHAKFKDIRDKFVAHSVNYSEENAVQVKLDDSDPNNPQITSIGTIHSRVATFSNEDLLELRELATTMLQAIDAEYDKESDKVWEFLEQLPPTELQRVLKLPPRSTYRPHSAARRRFSGGG